MSRTATPSRKPKSTVISIRVSPELRQDVEHAAIADGTSVSAYVVDLLVNTFAVNKPPMPATSDLARALAMADAAHEPSAPLLQTPARAKQAAKPKPITPESQPPAQALTMAPAAPPATLARTSVEAPKAAPGSFMKQALFKTAQHTNSSLPGATLASQSSRQEQAGPTVSPMAPAPTHNTSLPPARVPSWNTQPEARSASYSPPMPAEEPRPLPSRVPAPITAPPMPAQNRTPPQPRAPSMEDPWRQSSYQDDSYRQPPYQPPYQSLPPSHPIYADRAPARSLQPQPLPMPRPSRRPTRAKSTNGEMQRFLSFVTSKLPGFRKPAEDDDESDERS